jgi:hypothetical protein
MNPRVALFSSFTCKYNSLQVGTHSMIYLHAHFVTLSVCLHVKPPCNHLFHSFFCFFLFAFDLFFLLFSSLLCVFFRFFFFCSHLFFG